MRGHHCILLAESSMVSGMVTTQKVTVTLPIQQVEAIRDLVAKGEANSVSGFVQHAVQVSLDDVVGWGTMLAHALRETGGEITPQERAWADEAMAHPGSADVA